MTGWQHIKPRRVVEALTVGGWELVGERRGPDGAPVYQRLAVVDGDHLRHIFVVPLDMTAPEYADTLNAVARSLERLLADGRAARKVLARIFPDRFR